MSKKEKINKKILLTASIFIILSGILFYFYKNTPLPNLPLAKGEGQGGGYTISFKGETTDKMSVYDFMVDLQKEGKITFKDKNYPGMGEMIEEINGIKNNGNKNWIYYVNGKEATVGVSNYKINPRDIVSWKYE